MCKFRQKKWKRVRARMFNLACAVALFGATVVQGGVFCLCPSADIVTAEEACPCQGCQHDEGAAPSAGDVVFAASSHACEHLAFEVLQPAKQSDGGKVVQVRQAPLATSCLFAKPTCLVHSTTQGMPEAIARVRHKPPICVMLQQQLC